MKEVTGQLKSMEKHERQGRKIGKKMSIVLISAPWQGWEEKGIVK
jgi:hypothetical protein